MLELYGPLGISAIAVAVLIYLFPGKGVDRRTLLPNIRLFLVAFVLFVAIDQVTGRAITGNRALAPFAIALIGVAFVMLVVAAIRNARRRRSA